MTIRLNYLVAQQQVADFTHSAEGARPAQSG